MFEGRVARSENRRAEFDFPEPTPIKNASNRMTPDRIRLSDPVAPHRPHSRLDRMNTQSNHDGSYQHRICPIPEEAHFVVTIDGRPYAAFVDRSYAERAVKMWLGEIDGNGEPVPNHERKGPTWRALRGRKLDIVE